MKQIKYFLAAIFFFMAAGAFAQNNMEDVVYLKNGNIYRGLIIEQVPGESYKIQINGGSIFSITVPEVQKITKEPRYHSPVAAVPKPEDDFRMAPHFAYHHRDTTAAYLKKKRFFSSIEFRPGVNNASFHIVHGFKFGRLGYIGIGIGADIVSFGNGMADSKHLFDNTNVNNGLYVPVYLQYSGDILRKRITPYYYIEAGYAAHPNNPFVNANGNKSWGGPTAAAGFGCKFNSKGKVSLAINMNVNWRTNRYRTTYNTTDVFGNAYTYTKEGVSSKLFGALGLAIGF